ncbi:unnamed protein product [Pylaiella littoralis]
MECSIGFGSLKEMQRDSHGAFVLWKASQTIFDWFKERLN